MAENEEGLSLPKLSADCAPLFDFCRAHKRIFLYGAGDYAGKYTLLLDSEHIGVEAYIVTDEQHKAEYLGRPVYSAAEARKLLREGDGIVPAFKGCTPQFVMKMLNIRAEDIIWVNHGVLADIGLYYALKKGVFAMQNDRLLPEQCKTLPIAGIEDILVVRIKQGWGDMITSTAFLRELRGNYPTANIAVVCDRINESLLQNCPYINQLFLYDPCQKWNETLLESVTDVNQIWHVKKYVQKHFCNRIFDLMILPEELYFGNSTEELQLAISIQAKIKVTRCFNTYNDNVTSRLPKMLEPYFSFIAITPCMESNSKMQLELLRECGLTVKRYETEIWISENAKNNAKEHFDYYGLNNRICVAVALKGRNLCRCWNISNFRKLFALLNVQYGDKIRVLILGGEDAARDAAILAQAKNVVSFAGKLTMDESAAMMSRCVLYIGPSTSLLHMATALRVPSVTLYHVLTDAEIPNDGPMRWGPDDNLPHVSLLPPPGLDGCHEYCRKPYAHCINLITPEQVCEAAVKLLGGRGD